MIEIRRSQDRGHSVPRSPDDWLESFHSFSFSDYYDPSFMGFRSLRVINEDRVAPGKGFEAHSHRDMEILTYVIDGELEHKDSMGNGSIIKPGDVQRMSAGKGVTHSEFNPSKNHPVHFLQIWIIPEREGIDPSYEQKTFSKSERENKLCLLAAHQGDLGGVEIHQDAYLYGALLDPGNRVSHILKPKRQGWVQVVRGEIEIGKGNLLGAGDGAGIRDLDQVEIIARSAAEVLFFDLA